MSTLVLLTYFRTFRPFLCSSLTVVGGQDIFAVNSIMATVGHCCCCGCEILRKLGSTESCNNNFDCLAVLVWFPTLPYFMSISILSGLLAIILRFHPLMFLVSFSDCSHIA